MALSFNGTSEYLETTSSISAVPLTIAAWFNSTSTTAGQTICTVCATGGSTANRFGLFAGGDATGDPVRAIVGNTGANADTTTGYTANTWHHAAGVFTSNTSRTAYIDGGSAGTNTTSSTPTGVNAIVIGARYASTLGAYFSGSLAEIGVWSTNLSSAEITSLAKGMSPRFIRPQSLIAYFPLVREKIEIRSGLTITTGGSPAASNHPRVYT